MRHSLSRRFTGAAESAPSPEAWQAIASLVRLLEGGEEDISPIPVDLSALPAFDRSVLEHTRLIPQSETRTYGAIASALGSAGAARAVGRALGRNPIPILIPCHRVLAASGRSGGFSAPGGVTTKMKLLQIERARRTGAAEMFPDLPLAMRPSR